MTLYGGSATTPVALTSGDGANFIHANDYGLGSYAFTFNGPSLDTAQCGCAYASPAAQSASIQVNRVLPGWIWGVLAALVFGVLVLVAFIYVVSVMRQPDKFPMRGELVFHRQDLSISGEPSPIHTQNLTTGRKSTLRLKGKNIPLPTNTKLEWMEISNSGIEGWAEEGRVNISYKVKGSSIPNNVTVSPATSGAEQPDIWVTLHGLDEGGTVLYKVTIENVPGGSGETQIYGDTDEYIYKSRQTDVGIN